MSGLASCGHNAGLRPGWWTVSGRGYRAVSLTPEKVGGASFLPRSGSLELYSSPEKIGKHQSNLHLLVRPILRRHQIDIEVAGKEVEEFAMWDHPVRVAPDGDIGNAAVSAVVEEHAVTGIAHALGERLDEIERAA